MSIRPEHAAFYRSSTWTKIRGRILQRAGHRCECTGECGDAHPRGIGDDHGPVANWCAAPNREVIERLQANRATWQLAARDGQVLKWNRPPWGAMLTVVLTIAHLDGDTGEVPDDRLKALCQRCHLKLDAAQHARNAAATRQRKREVREPLLPFEGGKP